MRKSVSHKVPLTHKLAGSHNQKSYPYAAEPVGYVCNDLEFDVSRFRAWFVCHVL